MAVNPQVASAAISAIGSLFSSGMSLGGASASSHKQYKYAKRLMNQQAKLNYEYGLKSLQNSPTAEREGLETAGYNPMLAVQNATSGANSGWTGSQSVQAPDYGSAVSNALDFQRVKNETKSTDSTVKLQEEQSKTEESKRENLEFQNSMLDVEKHLKQKDLDAYDRRFYTEMYEMMQNAEKMRQEASVVGYNAESSRIIANAQKQQAATQKDFVDKHTPSGRSQSFNNYMSGVHHGLSGIGEIIHGYNESSNYNGSNESETVYYDKNGNVRGSVSHRGKNKGSSSKRGKRR